MIAHTCNLRFRTEAGLRVQGGSRQDSQKINKSHLKYVINVL